MNNQQQDRTHKYNVGDVVEVDHIGRCEITEVRHPNWSRETLYTVKVLETPCVYESDIELCYTEHGEEE